jgi:arylsulfatase A-like enzyme
VSDAGLAWLDGRRGHAEQPFFLFLHYFDVHYDYAPPEEGYARRFWPDGRRPRLNGDSFFENPEIRAGMDPEDLAGVVSYYDGEILWTDEQVGRVLDRLAALELEQDTLVVVVSDHGDEFFEHGAKGHRQNLFEPTLDVALLARLPGRLNGGRRITPRVSLVDVAPTILELTGALPKADFHAPDVATPALAHGMWGRSLLPLVDGRERGDRDCLAFLANRWQEKEHPADTWALWTGSLKAIVTRRYDWSDAAGSGRRLVASSTTGQLFDLARDASEQHDLSKRADAAVRAALERFDATFGEGSELARLAATLPAGPPPPPLSPSEISRLAALGYAAPPTPPPLPPGTKLDQILPPPPRFPRDR